MGKMYSKELSYDKAALAHSQQDHTDTLDRTGRKLMKHRYEMGETGTLTKQEMDALF